MSKWDTGALRRDFTIIGVSAPFVVVIREADRVKGSLEFTHAPRVYFGFAEAYPSRWHGPSVD